MKKILLIACAVIGAMSRAAEPVQRPFHITALYHVGYWVRDIAKSRAFYHDYLGFDEPYSLLYPDGKLQMVVMKVNDQQVIYLFPNAARILPNGDNLDHLGLIVDDLAALREHLLARGIKVGTVNRGRIGDFLLGVHDPDGRTFEATQFAPEGQLLQHLGKGLSPIRISDHLLSANIMVSDLTASLRFYDETLGFKTAGTPAADGSVKVQVPDGTDCLVLTPISKSKADAAPVWAVPEYSLSVPSIEKAAEILRSRAAKTGFAPPSAPSLSRFGEREITCVDPDGTRVVLVESAAAKP